MASFNRVLNFETIIQHNSVHTLVNTILISTLGKTLPKYFFRFNCMNCLTKSGDTLETVS